MYSNPSWGLSISESNYYGHKINSKMGNVEIKERPRKTNTIFGQRNRPSSRSPFRDIIAPNSPYYRQLSPIRYSPIAKDRRSNIKQSLKAHTSLTKSPKPQEKQRLFAPKQRVRREVEGAEEEGGALTSQNKEKCEEIIRKVRNFNDFLVQLKRKLKQDCSASEKKLQRSEVSLSVKLQNERVQLQKYKKLVERELSKTHSIENISIQNANNGEKILTIQYQDISHPRQQQNINDQLLPVEQSQKTTNLDRRDNIHTAQIETENRENLTLTQRLLEISKNNQSVSSKGTHSKDLNQARSIWTILQKKTKQLGELLAKEQAAMQNGQELKDYLLVKERLVKINDLYASIASANKQSLEVERKIRGLLA